MGMSYTESRDIPIRYRIWFINRIVKEITKGNDSSEEDSRSAQRLMSRNNLPPNVRRFT